MSEDHFAHPHRVLPFGDGVDNNQQPFSVVNSLSKFEVEEEEVLVDGREEEGGGKVISLFSLCKSSFCIRPYRSPSDWKEVNVVWWCSLSSVEFTSKL